MVAILPKVAELARRYTWWSKAKNATISQLMHAFGRAIHNLQHLRNGLVSDISHSTTPLML